MSFAMSEVAEGAQRCTAFGLQLCQSGCSSYAWLLAALGGVGLTLVLRLCGAGKLAALPLFLGLILLAWPLIPLPSDGPAEWVPHHCTVLARYALFSLFVIPAFWAWSERGDAILAIAIAVLAAVISSSLAHWFWEDIHTWLAALAAGVIVVRVGSGRPPGGA